MFLTPGRQYVQVKLTNLSIVKIKLHSKFLLEGVNNVNVRNYLDSIYEFRILF